MEKVRKIDELILTELKSIKTDITNLRQEMNTRFDRVDERLFRLENETKEINSKREIYEIQTEHFKHTIYEDVVFKEDIKRFAEDNKLKYKIPTKNKY